ncbi:MAG: carboxypeptidase regulatory-like domain-containing protein [Deltaproteobacteria bacterium]|nr:carboxypeptidase regulatory-like domain-containing protein [Deltaproteobacteria bacterium]
MGGAKKLFGSSIFLLSFFLSVLFLTLLAGFSGVVWPAEAAPPQDGILLRYRGQVLEETDEYVIIKLRKADIELIRDRSRLGDSKNQDPERKVGTEKSLYLEREAVNRLKEELKKELKADVQEEMHKQGVKREDGSVEGRILLGGIGLAGCRVKLMRAPQSSSFQGIFKELKQGDEFETVTNEDGGYAFREIPVGDYQLQWLPKGGDSWIRRLTERPDVTVQKGKTFHARDVDLAKRVISG